MTTHSDYQFSARTKINLSTCAPPTVIVTLIEFLLSVIAVKDVNLHVQLTGLNEYAIVSAIMNSGFY